MDSKELLNRISIEDIKRLMVEYFGIPMLEEDETDKYVRFLTLCHHMDDPEEATYKLYLYKQGKNFYCYSNCGSMSLFDLVMQLKDISFQESIEFLSTFFRISTVPKGFGREVNKPMYEVQPYTPKKVDLNERLHVYDESILNTFLNYKPVEWLEEGISADTMDKFGIKFDMYTNGIIIPHRDFEGLLIGIRERTLDPRQIMLKRKYTPYIDFKSKIQYRHPLGKNLYGIDINQEKIKNSGKVILWESEKSVMKMDTIYGVNESLATGGSSVSIYQLGLLKKMGVNDVYLFYDYEEGELWSKKMKRVYEKVVGYGFNCYYIPQEIYKECLELKEAPIDKPQCFEYILKNVKKVESEGN